MAANYLEFKQNMNVQKTVFQFNSCWKIFLCRSPATIEYIQSIVSNNLEYKQKMNVEKEIVL